jgi:hypothetical protein
MPLQVLYTVSPSERATSKYKQPPELPVMHAENFSDDMLQHASQFSPSGHSATAAHCGRFNALSISMLLLPMQLEPAMLVRPKQAYDIDAIQQQLTSNLDFDLLLLLDLPAWCRLILIAVTQVAHCQLIRSQLTAMHSHGAHRLQQRAAKAAKLSTNEAACVS